MHEPLRSHALLTFTDLWPKLFTEDPGTGHTSIHAKLPLNIVRGLTEVLALVKTVLPLMPLYIFAQGLGVYVDYLLRVCGKPVRFPSLCHITHD